MNNVVLDFLIKCNLGIKDPTELDGLLISRDLLLSPVVYNNVKNHITELKKRFSSSSLTSLHKDAEKGQKWPLLNLVRQILKACGFEMKPKRKSAGYTKAGKKKYDRFFLIGKIKEKNQSVGGTLTVEGAPSVV
jgi:hypothetical protein